MRWLAVGVVLLGILVAGCGSRTAGSGHAGTTHTIKANWEAFFNGKTPASQKISLLQNGQAFASTRLGVDDPKREDRLAFIRTHLVDGLLVDNEANLAALTEIDSHLGESFIYVSGEIGIGAAIIVDGRCFTGLHGWAGEIGHIMVDRGGPDCACGATGCLEMYAGKQALTLGAGLEADASIDALVEACERGDSLARTAVLGAAEALGIALGACINIVDVSSVVLGGIFAPLVPYLSAPLLTELATRVLSSRWVDDLTVRASSGGLYAATTGGGLAVLGQAIADPTSLLWAPVSQSPSP